MTNSDQASFDADNCVPYLEGGATSIAVALLVKGVTLYCAHKKSQNYVAENTVPDTVVPRTFSQADFVLTVGLAASQYLGGSN